jgi:hypothetical protein
MTLQFIVIDAYLNQGGISDERPYAEKNVYSYGRRTNRNSKRHTAAVRGATALAVLIDKWAVTDVISAND